MISDLIILSLIIIGIICGFVFYKIIKHFNYELYFNESLLSTIPTLILTVYCLVDFSLLNIDFDVRIVIGIVVYFLALLLLYYFIRSIKLKKYIPFKTTISYILISIITLAFMGFLLDKTTNIDGWGALGLAIIYFLVYGIFIATLLLQNISIFIIELFSKNKQKYKNVNYKFNKFSYISMFATILIIGLIFGIDYYNEYNYNKLIKKQTDIVREYLKQSYPDYEFNFLDIYEVKVDCGYKVCMTPVFRNEIEITSSYQTFIIEVKKEDLTIYKDEFKEIVEEEQKNRKVENIKNYLKDNYNISLNYQINDEKIENVEFIISKNYEKEQIDLFSQDMKNVFNYIETNFYDLDYVILNFENGNPFYEGEYEYSKTKGYINDNSMTNELWLMVDDEYIFIKK